jgi:hypothetical protein
MVQMAEQEFTQTSLGLPFKGLVVEAAVVLILPAEPVVQEVVEMEELLTPGMLILVVAVVEVIQTKTTTAMAARVLSLSEFLILGLLHSPAV